MTRLAQPGSQSERTKELQSGLLGPLMVTMFAGRVNVLTTVRVY